MNRFHRGKTELTKNIQRYRYEGNNRGNEVKQRYRYKETEVTKGIQRYR